MLLITWCESYLYMNTVRRTAVRNGSSALTTMNHLCCLFIPRSAPSSPDVSPQSSPRPPRANNDRLTLLTRLVRKGEKKGLFVEKMPVSIYQVKQNLPLHELNTSYIRERIALSIHSCLTALFVCLCRLWEMRIWSSWETEMSTTATTSTSPFPWLQSMQYVSLLACLNIPKHRLKIHNALSFMYLTIVIKRHKTS